MEEDFNELVEKLTIEENFQALMYELIFVHFRNKNKWNSGIDLITGMWYFDKSFLVCYPLKINKN